MIMNANTGVVSYRIGNTTFCITASDSCLLDELPTTDRQRAVAWLVEREAASIAGAVWHTVSGALSHRLAGLIYRRNTGVYDIPPLAQTWLLELLRRLG